MLCIISKINRKIIVPITFEANKDNSSFTDVFLVGEKGALGFYKKLGFEYLTTTLSSHWYNLKTGQHILDSLLRSRGFDQLFGTNYGKGTSNKELIIQHGFLEVVDSGQSTYIWNNIES